MWNYGVVSDEYIICGLMFAECKKFSAVIKY
jgi:hypothetical protein